MRIDSQFVWRVDSPQNQDLTVSAILRVLHRMAVFLAPGHSHRRRDHVELGVVAGPLFRGLAAPPGADVAPELRLTALPADELRLLRGRSLRRRNIRHGSEQEKREWHVRLRS